MSDQSKRPRGRAIRNLMILAALAAIPVVLTPSSSANPPSADIKKFDVCLQYAGLPACTTAGSLTNLPGGSTAQLTLTVRNEGASNQSLGSSNFDAPASLPIDTQPSNAPQVTASSSGTGTVVRVGNELQLRNLNLGPGGWARVTLSVDVPCLAPDVAWPAPTAKQSNQYNGSGNDFSYVSANATGMTSHIVAGPGCLHLAFLSQPAETQVGSTITDAPASTGGAIKVGLQDASNNPVASCPIASCSVVLTNSSTDGTSGGTWTRPFQLDSGVGGLVASFGDLSIGGIPAVNLPESVTLTATGANNLAPAVASNPFQVSLVAISCAVGGCSIDKQKLPGKNGNQDSLFTLSTGSGFSFVTLNSSTLTSTPQGCEGFRSSGVAGFAESDGRTPGGTLLLTYYVNQDNVKANYGANVGQQFLPICAGAKPIDQTTHQAVNCTNVGSTVGGWDGDQLDPATHLFTAAGAKAVCNADGYYWGILGSFQDKNKGVDPANDPAVTGWGGKTLDKVTYRYFQISVPPNWDFRGNG